MCCSYPSPDHHFTTYSLNQSFRRPDETTKVPTKKLYPYRYRESLSPTHRYSLSLRPTSGRPRLAALANRFPCFLLHCFSRHKRRHNPCYAPRNTEKSGKKAFEITEILPQKSHQGVGTPFLLCFQTPIHLRAYCGLGFVLTFARAVIIPSSRSPINR